MQVTSVCVLLMISNKLIHGTHSVTTYWPFVAWHVLPLRCFLSLPVSGKIKFCKKICQSLEDKLFTDKLLLVFDDKLGDTVRKAAVSTGPNSQICLVGPVSPLWRIFDPNKLIYSWLGAYTAEEKAQLLDHRKWCNSMSTARTYIPSDWVFYEPPHLRKTMNHWPCSLRKRHIKGLFNMTALSWYTTIFSWFKEYLKTARLWPMSNRAVRLAGS